MKIRSLSLTNIKCYSQLNLDFSVSEFKTKLRVRTVILGNNGTGKSTILKSVALVMAGTDATAELLGAPSDWIRTGQQEASIEASIQISPRAVIQVDLIFDRSDSLQSFLHRNAEDLEKVDAASGKKPALRVGYGVSRRVSINESITSFGRKSSASQFSHLVQ